MRADFNYVVCLSYIRRFTYTLVLPGNVNAAALPVVRGSWLFTYVCACMCVCVCVCVSVMVQQKPCPSTAGVGSSLIGTIGRNKIGSSNRNCIL